MVELTGYQRMLRALRAMESDETLRRFTQHLHGLEDEAPTEAEAEARAELERRISELTAEMKAAVGSMSVEERRARLRASASPAVEGAESDD